jgi:rod shape-determining protein MreB
LVVSAVLACLEHIPPDLGSDVADTGIVLAGGGALLPSLDRLLGQATGLPVVVPDEPALIAVMGAGRILEDPDLLRAAEA